MDLMVEIEKEAKESWGKSFLKNSPVLYGGFKIKVDCDSGISANTGSSSLQIVVYPVFFSNAQPTEPGVFMTEKSCMSSIEKHKHEIIRFVNGTRIM